MLELDKDSNQKEGRDDEAEKFLAYCFAHSLFIVHPSSPLKDLLSTQISHAPITCAPLPFPRAAFQNAIELMPTLNRLCIEMHTKECFWDLIFRVREQDKFIDKLFSCYCSESSKFEFCVQRADYMLDQGGNIKQVEINTIAAALYGLGPRVTELHRRGLAFCDDIPENRALEIIVKGFRKANKLYQDAYNVQNTIILMIIQEEERNMFDQSAFIDAVGIPVIRRTFSELVGMNEKSLFNQPLMINGKEVSIVYYRAGYTPTDYKSGACWTVRRAIEWSRATKCPSIITQLAGMKKMQEMLANPKVIQKFGIQKLSKCFAKFYKPNELPSLNLNNVVVKPQREGGGNNYYGSDIPKIILQLVSNPDAYVIMQRIDSPPQRVRALSNGKIIEMSAVAELGIFGVVIADNDGFLWNETAGYVLRTKAVESHEGGFMRGDSFIDAPLLV